MKNRVFVVCFPGVSPAFKVRALKNVSERKFNTLLNQASEGLCNRSSEGITSIFVKLLENNPGVFVFEGPLEKKQ